MKIILLGSNGMLGAYLNKYLGENNEVIALTRKDYDLSKVNVSDLSLLLDKIVSQDSVIINAAGIIKQRDYNSIEMIMVNSVLPNVLSEIKNMYTNKNLQVIHVTTDCVYNGKTGGYDENSPHECIDDYSMSKSLGENKNLTNIRTSIIGEEITYKKSLLEWVRSNKAGSTIYGYVNHLWNGVTCLELAKFIDDIVKEKRYWKGVRHIISNTVSKHELVSLLNNIYELGLNIEQKSTPEHCYRNLATVYNSRIKATLEEQIKEMSKYKL